MKKLKLFFACLLMAVLSIGQVWAAEELKATIDFSSNDFSIPTSKTVAENTYTHDGISMTLTGTSGNGYAYYSKDKYLLNGKQGATITFSAFEWKTTKIVVTGRSGASGSTKMNIFVGENAVSTETTGCTGTNTYNIASTSQAAGTIYTLKVTSAHNAQFTKFEIYGEDAGTPAKTLTSIAVSGTPTKTAYYAGDEFDPAGLVVTGTYSDDSQAPIASGITWAYDPSQTLALNQTSIGVIATVSEISSPKFNVTGLTVTEAPAAVNYEKVTSAPADWSGEYILVYESGSDAYVYTGVDANNNYAAATISDDVIAIPEGAVTLTIASMEGGYSIRIGGGTNDGKYISGTSGTNTTKFGADPVANTLAITDGSAVITAGEAIAFNSGSATLRFRYYKPGQKAVQLYKKVDGAVKPSAELSYAAADQKKLTKLGEAFTAPTLENPHTVAVTYASNNTDVAEVAANGAVTIKAAGVAVITASFAGNDDYKAGSASYTIGVTAHAGTETDPFVAADVKIVVDAVETLENAYATGIVSNVVTTTLPTEGYISFYFSADGLTSGQQVEAFKCYGLNSAQFEAVTDVVTGATVVVTGTLKKYNSIYEFDANCHLVSYTAPAAPKQSIANDQANPYTVAQAITFAADGVTYDLDDYVYVQGVVYDVQSFNNGAMNIFIKDANAENQFELYKCAGINDGSATTPFDALSDVQAGNIVIGYGQLSYHAPYYEFKQGNYLVDLQTPATGIELDATAEVEVGSTVNLTATILPSNATGTIVWSVESGSDNASVDAGVVTGSAEGEAVIRATVQGTEIYAECTVTVTAASAPLTDYYQKVTETAGITDGTYLIVYEGDNTHTPVAFNGALETLEAVGNNIPVTITNDKKIAVTEATEASTFFIDVTAGSIQSASGKYIGANSYGNRLDQSEEASTYVNALSIDGDGNAVISISNTSWEGDLTLRYNYGTNNGERFRYYKSGQQAIQLYKLANETVKANPELAWSGDVEITLGETFTAPTLDNPHSVEGITYASDNEALATVTNAGVIELDADATGTAHITASFAGNDDYKAASVSCTIIVNASAPTPLPTAEAKVIVVGYNSKFYAMSTTVKNSNGFEPIEVTKEDDKIIVKSDEDAAAIQWQIALGAEAATFQNGESKYLACSDESNTGLALLDDASEWAWDATASCYKQPGKDNKGRTFYYNYNNGSPIFRAYTVAGIGADGYSGAPEFISADKIEVQVPTPKINPELAFDPAEVELTLGETFTAPTLGHVDGFNGTITYSSSKPAVATVDENTGEVTIVANGTTTITASFEGNDDYEEDEAIYTITVNKPAPTPTSTIYRKVTATADITDGEYLIVYEGDATHNAAVFDGSLDNDNIDVAKKVLAVEIENDEIAGNTELDAATFTIDVTAKTLQSASGYYIGRETYDNGMDKSTTEAYVNTFAITDGAAVITGVGGCTLRYNYASDQLRFRYYKSGQQAIQLYKKETTKYSVTYAANGGSGDAPVAVEYEEGETFTVAAADLFTAPAGKEFDKWNDGTNDYAPGATYTVGTADVVLTAYWKDAAPEPVYTDIRTGLTAGNYYTVCWPKKMTAINGATLWSFAGKDDDMAYLIQEEAPFEAGKPYIIYATAEKLEAVVEGDDAPAGHNNGLYGTLSYMDDDALATAGATYMLKSNALRPIGPNNHLDANRAYVILSQITGGKPNAAPGKRVIAMPMQKDAATGFENIESGDAPVKVMIEGTLYILRGEKVYDATGRLVK